MPGAFLKSRVSAAKVAFERTRSFQVVREEDGKRAIRRHTYILRLCRQHIHTARAQALLFPPNGQDLRKFFGRQADHQVGPYDSLVKLSSSGFQL